MTLHLALHLILYKLKSIQMKFRYQGQALQAVGSQWPLQSWTKRLALSSRMVHPIGRISSETREVTSWRLPYFAHIPFLVSAVVQERLIGSACLIIV